MTPAEMKQFIRDAFANVIEDVNASEETYAKYFSKHYVQYVDGKQLDYDDFVAHMKAQKAVMQSLKITFKHIIVEGDKLATVHIADGVKKDGGLVQAQINALFQIEDKKIILCDELTMLMKETKADRDLGSRH